MELRNANQKGRDIRKINLMAEHLKMLQNAWRQYFSYVFVIKVLF